jgi:hypothetical protein
LGFPSILPLTGRKPENGGDIQGMSCSKRGIMLRLEVVKGADEADQESHESEKAALHGAQVLYELVSPWRNSHRIVCADSYFVLVPAALLLWRHELRFIGVIKTATKQYLYKILHNKVLRERGGTMAWSRRKEH